MNLLNSAFVGIKGFFMIFFQDLSGFFQDLSGFVQDHSGFFRIFLILRF